MFIAGFFIGYFVKDLKDDQDDDQDDQDEDDLHNLPKCTCTDVNFCDEYCRTKARFYKDHGF